MLNFIATILTAAIATFASAVGLYNYLPVGYLEIGQSTPKLGSTITTINATDLISASRTTINTNFTNLNTDKAEIATTQQFTGIQKFTIASTTLFSCTGTCYFGATATSSFSTAGALTLVTPLTVANGGTGSTTLSQFNVLLGSSTNAIGMVAGLGTTGQFLTSNGAGLPPTWQTSAVDTAINYTWTGAHTFNTATTTFGVGFVSQASSTIMATTTVNTDLVVNRWINGSPVFGGTGVDGALSITSGTTTINAANAAVVIKNYSSISITSTGALTISNPNTNGTVLILKSQGSCTDTSSVQQTISMWGMGGAGGAGGSGIADGNAGSDGQGHLISGFGGNFGTSAGANGAAQSSSRVALKAINYGMPATPGGGGGGGGQAGSSQDIPGNGGNGGGALIIECKGAINFTGRIDAGGKPGTDATENGATGAGGGGGGGGGSVSILYGSLTALSSTINVAGGAGGTGLAGGTPAGAGGGGSGMLTGGAAGSGTTGGAGGNGSSLTAQISSF